jgi:multiple sugar transport system permease protein
MRSRGRFKNNRFAIRALVSVALVLLVVWALFPVCWILLTSIKENKEIYSYPLTFLPRKVTMQHYYASLVQSPFPLFMRNSLIVSVVVTVLSIAVCSPAAYALARMRFRGRRILARMIVVSYLLPPTFLFIPLFIVVQKLEIVDTLLAPIVTYLTFTVPFCTWMLLAYFRTIPKDIEDAARSDGATRFQALIRIVLPLAVPGLSVVALYAFVRAWNEFLYALIFLNSNQTKTITVGLSGLIMGDVFLWGQMMASSVIGILPVFIIFIVAQRYLVEGLAVGAVKQ